MQEKYLPSNIFEGLTSIRAVIASRDSGVSSREIKEIHYDTEKLEKHKKEIAWLSRMSAKHGFKLIPTTSESISELTLGTTHGGFVAVCGERNIPALTIDCINPDGYYVMLDGIEDPYNFGTALRTVYASGADGIILPPRNWMSSAGIVCRSSAGTSETANLLVSDADGAVDIFRSAGYKIICSAKEKSTSMYETDLTFPVFLIIGGERRGIAHRILNKADKIVRIDYGREFNASLSAQSSAAVLAFEVYRQNNVK